MMAARRSSSARIDEEEFQRELRLPTYYLLAWHRKKGRWVAARRGLVSWRVAVSLIEKGDPRYEKIMMVSQTEFRVLGMPADREAREYHSIEGQRRVSKLYGGPRERGKKRDV